MALSFGVTLLSLAVLLFGISIKPSNTKEICTLQLVDKEGSDSNAEVHDATNTETKYKRASWQWVCKESNEYKTADYEQEEEEPNRRVRRAWGTRRSSSSSSRSSLRGWGSRRSSSSSRSNSGIWGSRTSSSSSRRNSGIWGSRTSSSSSRRNSGIWGSRTSSSSSRSNSRIGGSRTSSSSSRSNSRIGGSNGRSSASSSESRSTSNMRMSVKSGGSSAKRPKQNPEPKSTSQKSGVWDKVHNALDTAGMVPGIGNVADGINAGLHAARGNWKDAALSAAGMIPVAGQAVTAGKLAKKSKNLQEFVSKSVLDRKSHKNRKGKYESTRRTHESYDVAKKVFEKETGKKPDDIGVSHSKTKDGKYHLTVRDKSKYTKEATMDIKDIKTGDVVKIRCQGGHCKKP